MWEIRNARNEVEFTVLEFELHKLLKQVAKHYNMKRQKDVGVKTVYSTDHFDLSDKTGSYLCTARWTIKQNST